MSYQSEKFNAARRKLMLPIKHGEGHAIADAFFEVSLCMEGLVNANLPDPDVIARILKLKDYMDTTGDTHTVQSAAWAAKAKVLPVERKSEIAEIVDELAWWFTANPHYP